jgi:hypothetical protein
MPPRTRPSQPAAATPAVKTLLVANDFLEVQIEEPRAKIWTGYARSASAARIGKEDQND